MSKVWAVVLDDPASPLMATFAPGLGDTHQYVNQGGLSRAAILNAVDASLARLETTYLDLLQIHAFDPSTPFEETMKALHDVVTSGKARYIGASNLKAWQFAEMNHVAKLNGWTEFVSIQIEHSLLYRPEVRFWWLQHSPRFTCMLVGAGNVSLLPLQRDWYHTICAALYWITRPSSRS
jgi:hypothetical protein